MFPVRYAQERIFLLGKDAVDPLLAIVSNPAEDAAVRKKAWDVLVCFDDPRIGDEIRAEVESGRIGNMEAGSLIGGHFDMGTSGVYAGTWLRKIKGLSRQEIGLLVLDEMMKPEKDLASDCYYVLRWLNLYEGQDLDEWLAQKAPDALEFRNRELARGYDPVFAFERLRTYLRDGQADEGAKALFADAQTQKACLQLIDATHGVGQSPLRIPDRPGWEKRLREWYAKHRSELRYDPNKHRLVVGGGAGK